jgi:hypothetical protein
MKCCCVVLARRAFTITLLAAMVSSVAPAIVGSEEKITPEELVAKHLAAIGPTEAWTAAASRAIAGRCTAMFKLGGTGQASGPARLDSEGIKSVLIMQFGTSDYPHEKFGYDGKEVTAAQVRPGLRSSLSQFILANETPLTEGLLGGTLSAAWPLADLANRKPRLKYNGIKKPEGRELHELQYSPKKSSQLKITLYFDKNTFEHVRTQYRLSRTTGLPTLGAPDRQSSGLGPEAHYVLTEDFSDYFKEGALILPHAYKLSFSVTGTPGTQLIDWVLQFDQFTFGSRIDPKEFDVDK